MSSKPYYTLAVFSPEQDQFVPEFGDWNRDTVKAELQVYVDHGYQRWALRIIESSIANDEAVQEASDADGTTGDGSGARVFCIIEEIPSGTWSIDGKTWTTVFTAKTLGLDEQRIKAMERAVGITRASRCRSSRVPEHRAVRRGLMEGAGCGIGLSLNRGRRVGTAEGRVTDSKGACWCRDNHLLDFSELIMTQVPTASEYMRGALYGLRCREYLGGLSQSLACACAALAS